MLKRVSIQNFKSLKDVTLDLQKVNLLIGPNNSGKTNFLKALEFFRFGVLQDDVTAEHQSRDFRFKRSSDTLSIELILERQDEEITFLREFVFSDPSSAVDVKSAQIIKNNGVEIARNDQGYPDIAFLRRALNSLRIYKPDPNKLTQPAYFSADEIELKGDCSNLIPFLFYLNTNYKRVYQELEKNLDKCVRDIVSFSTPPVKVEGESKLGLKFFGKNDENYWAEDVSEGVLYFLALLTIINQPNPPKLLLLEEPEKGIHPRRIWEVVKFIFQLAEEKDVQVILTTHNEHVVNAFSTMPESVFVFDKDDEGATYVRNLQTDIIKPTDRKSEELGLDKIDLTSNLGENWLYGLIGGVPADEL
ncbi:AAA family ATPase [Spirosoma pulveris]